MREVILGTHEVLGDKILLTILNIKPETLKRFVDDPSRIPLNIEDKLKFILPIIRNLRQHHSYYGIRRWFKESSLFLKDKSPIELLSKNWWPRDQKIIDVLLLSSVANAQ